MHAHAHGGASIRAAAGVFGEAKIFEVAMHGTLFNER